MIDAGRLLGRWLESRPEWAPWLVYATLALLIVVLWRCAREEHVDENGRVHVRWHPPWRWPARIRARVHASRSGYSRRARRGLSFAWRALEWTRAALAWFVALALLAMLLLNVDPARCPPCLSDGVSGWFAGAVVAALAVAVFLSRGIARDDPFADHRFEGEGNGEDDDARR